MTWLSLLCASNRPNDLKKWLDSLYENCVDPKSIELSLTLEKALDPDQISRWGNVVITYVEPKQYNINQLTEICYKQSTSSFIFLSGDDTICHTKNWDVIFKNEIDNYPDKIVLVYPNDMIFESKLACYPVTSRLVMDNMPFPVPFERYAIDDTIFDCVPYSRRIYLKDVVMEHLHLVDNPPGTPVIRNGVTKYYPHEVEAMARDRALYIKETPTRNAVRRKLAGIAGLKQDLKIMIAVPTQEMARRADFYDYFNMLQKPEGTVCTFAHGQSPARNRNIMIRQALENECTHILFLDDDMAFKPNLLEQLLSHGKDIVSGLYLMRNYPHFPVMFDASYDDGRCKFSFLDNGRTGLVEAVNFGLGACLIKTDVFKNMPDPWITLGELDKDHWCDDIAFFNRARKAGYKLYIDLDCPVGHMMSAIIWPDRDKDGNWFTVYNTGSSEVFKVPQVIPTEEEQIASLKRSGVYNGTK